MNFSSFIAGDHVKFGFPMAYTLTTLAWGLLTNYEAYSAGGNLDTMLDCIDWPLEYFIKAHQWGGYHLFGQAGSRQYIFPEHVSAIQIKVIQWQFNNKIHFLVVWILPLGLP